MDSTIDNMGNDERLRLEAIAQDYRYVLRPCRDGTPGVTIPERDAKTFPKMQNYLISKEAAGTLLKITVSDHDAFIVVPLELIG
jgi:hypothetical protein